MDFNSVMCGVVGCVAEVNRRKQREYECLQEGNQQLQEVHENHKGSGEHPDARASSNRVSVVAEDEDQACERKDDDVARADVRCQTNHQYCRLHDDAHDFDRHQDELHRYRDTGRPEDVTPVMFVAAEVGNQENQRRQRHGYANGSCNIEAAQERNQAQQVAKEDEEEDRQQERHVPICFIPDGWFGNLITNEEDQRLQRVGHSLRCLAWILLVVARHSNEHPYHDGKDDQHTKHALRDGEIQDIQRGAV